MHGSSIDRHGSRAILAAVVLLAWLAATHHARAQCEAERLRFDGTMSLFALGESVDIDGEWAVAGAWWGAVPATYPGRAVVFHRGIHNEWTEHAVLAADDGEDFDEFGRSVAISGSWIVVGAQYAGASSGAAYLFEIMPDGAIAQRQTLTIDGSYAFGRFVALDDSTLAVAHPGLGDGSVHLYRRDGATWSPEAILHAPDGALESIGTHAIALDGATLLALTSYKHAFIFTRSTRGAWQAQADLRSIITEDAGGGENGAALLGDLAVIGNTSDNDPTPLAGAAWVFRRDRSGQWSFEQELNPVEATDGMLFGWSVGVGAVEGGGVIAVGALHDSAEVFRGGSVTVFTQPGSGGHQWSFHEHITLDNAPEDSHFGCSLAMAGETMIIGANIHGPGGHGAAYVVDSGLKPGDTNCDGFVNILDLLLVIGAWGPCGRQATCPADVAPWMSSDGIVGIADLLAVIGAWGICPPPTSKDPGCCPADVTNDGGVGIADMLLVIATWG